VGGETPSGIYVWSLIRNEKPIVLFEKNCHATVKSEAIACARRCRSSLLTGWWKKWRAEGEERHKGSLIPPPPKKKEVFVVFGNKVFTKVYQQDFRYLLFHEKITVLLCILYRVTGIRTENLLFL
jgi:hypothetical protein